MYRLLAVLPFKIPNRLHAVSENYALRTVSPDEAAAIETKVTEDGGAHFKVQGRSVLIIPFAKTQAKLDLISLSSFALSLLSRTSHASVETGCFFLDDKCTDIIHATAPTIPAQPLFSTRLTAKGTIKWIKNAHTAYTKDPLRMHVTATRYNRYLRTGLNPDGLLDLCIALESLLDAQNEISFRFSVCLARIAGGKGAAAEKASDLLKNLYDLRSNVVHGNPKTMSLIKDLASKESELREIAREILVRYVLFLVDHDRKEWGKFLRTQLFQ